jgi:hypothetical protein
VNLLTELSDVAGSAIGPVTLETSVSGPTQIYPSTGGPSSAGPIARAALSVLRPSITVGGVSVQPWGDPAPVRTVFYLVLAALALWVLWKWVG